MTSQLAAQSHRHKMHLTYCNRRTSLQRAPWTDHRELMHDAQGMYISGRAERLTQEG
jgi:hypothetical protein